MSNRYLVYVIKRKDGEPIPEAAQKYLLETGAVFDSELGGFIVLACGMPVSYMIFLPAHDLVVSEGSVDYDPEWSSPRSPEQVFEDLSHWDGGELETGEGRKQLSAFFWAGALNNGRPFIAWWKNGFWDYDDTLYSPEAAKDQWVVVSTMGECIDMTCTRIDRANSMKQGKSQKNAIHDDIEGAAFQVGIATGRLSRFMVTERLASTEL